VALAADCRLNLTPRKILVASPADHVSQCADEVHDLDDEASIVRQTRAHPHRDALHE
jgi:hypothetical protein